MAGIIISESSNVVNSVFGEVQGPLKVVIENAYKEILENDGNRISKIFKPFNLDSASGTIQSLGSLGQFQIAGENGAYPQTDLKESWAKTVRPHVWKLEVAISRELLDDKLFNIMADRVKMLTASYNKTRNNFFWGLLGSAVQQKDLVFGGRTHATKSWDDVNLFSNKHPIELGSKKYQSNAFSNAFSVEALGSMATEMQNVKDEHGEFIGLTPDTLLIPNLEKAKREVFGVLGANYNPDVAGSNQYNYQFGNWNVIVAPWMNKYITGENYQWIMLDSQYNADNYGALDVKRIDLEVKSEVAENDANLWKGYARFGGAFGDWRGFAIGGVEYGDELA